ncbi:hypothetical protein HHI36_024254, partial [Cryptolaemus montrouzieri]
MSEHLFDLVHGLIRRKIKLYDLTSEELCQLPLAYYKKEAKGYEVNMVWNRLSEEYKKELIMLDTGQSQKYLALIFQMNHYPKEKTVQY